MKRRAFFIAVLSSLARFLVLLYSSAIIAPDEHFQNAEVVTSHFYSFNGNTPLRTWEWQSEGGGPIRSVPSLLPTAVVFGLWRVIQGRERYNEIHYEPHHIS